MTAELLRQAADRLDALAGAARAGRWFTVGTEVKAAWLPPVPVTTCDGSPLLDGNLANAAYIAAMSPLVGKALAAWLREAAESWRLGTEFTDEGLAVARAILGDHQ